MAGSQSHAVRGLPLGESAQQVYIIHNYSFKILAGAYNPDSFLVDCTAPHVRPDV
jgi:hypothetical protein